MFVRFGSVRKGKRRYEAETSDRLASRMKVPWLRLDALQTIRREITQSDLQLGSEDCVAMSNSGSRLVSGSGAGDWQEVAAVDPVRTW